MNFKPSGAHFTRQQFNLTVAELFIDFLFFSFFKKMQMILTHSLNVNVSLIRE